MSHCNIIRVRRAGRQEMARECTEAIGVSAMAKWGVALSVPFLAARGCVGGWRVRFDDSHILQLTIQTSPPPSETVVEMKWP